MRTELRNTSREAEDSQTKEICSPFINVKVRILALFIHVKVGVNLLTIPQIFESAAETTHVVVIRPAIAAILDFFARILASEKEER